MTWTVHKFGGTSVADASCIRRVAGIIGGQRRGNQAVVVSAMKGVTDDLLGLVDKAVKRLVAAVQLGVDPVELRRRNFLQPDEFPYTTLTGARYDSGDYDLALRQASIVTRCGRIFDLSA